MKIIVAGYPKTGTKTLNAALTILGYNVYDYLDNIIVHQKAWEKILNEGWSTDDFKRMYENIDAVTDTPAFYFWEEIHKAFPQAKIILMQRDEESWLKSAENQMQMRDSNFMFSMMPYLSPTFRKTNNAILKPAGTKLFAEDITHKPIISFRKNEINKELAKLKFRAHNAYVLQNAPKDKLLVYECSQGWEPLCEFLNVPKPNEEFPHRNKNGNNVQKSLKHDPLFQIIKREMLISATIITSGLTAATYFIWTRGPVNLLRSGVSACKNLSLRLNPL